MEVVLVLVELPLQEDEAVKVHQREQLRDLLQLLATTTPSLVRQRHMAEAEAEADGAHLVEQVVLEVAEREALATLSVLLEPQTLVAVAAEAVQAVSQVVLEALASQSFAMQMSPQSPLNLLQSQNHLDNHTRST